MNALHIRDVGPGTLSALERLARSHHRSLQGELREVLDRAARLAPPDTERDEIHLVTVKTGRADTWSRADIYDNQGR